MHFSILLLALVVTSHAWMHVSPLEARRHDDNDTATSIDKVCKRIEVLTRLNVIAINQFALNDMPADGKLAQARIDWIKSKSAEISAELDTLTANSTLTAECDTINAQRDAAKECKQIQKLEKLVDLANNQTAQTAPGLLSQDLKIRLQQKLEKAELKLQELKSNSTLMGLCANDVSLQQNGAISNRESCGPNIYIRTTDQRVEAVDNSGAIGMTKSGAVTYKVLSRRTAYSLASVVVIYLLFL
jgi:hypothetical protein